MSSILTLLNDTRELLGATKIISDEEREAYEEAGIERTGLDVELGRFFSLDGYNVAQLFGVGLGDKLYRVQSFKIEDKWYATISVKNGFVFNTDVFEDPKIYDTTAKIKAGSTVEFDRTHLEIFIEALKVEEWDEVYNIGEGDKLPDIQHNECVAIYSPLLGI